jgi:hypothetical protein
LREATVSLPRLVRVGKNDHVATYEWQSDKSTLADEEPLSAVDEDFAAVEREMTLYQRSPAMAFLSQEAENYTWEVQSVALPGSSEDFAQKRDQVLHQIAAEHLDSTTLANVQKFIKIVETPEVSRSELLAQVYETAGRRLEWGIVCGEEPETILQNARIVTAVERLQSDSAEVRWDSDQLGRESKFME